MPLYSPPSIPKRSSYPPLSFASLSVCRHGQSEYNAVERIGGDSGLTEHGLNYARKLAEFVEENVGSA